MTGNNGLGLLTIGRLAVTEDPAVSAAQVPFTRWGDGIVGTTPDAQFQLRVNQAVVSRAGGLVFTVGLDGDVLSAFGIGGVATPPAHRRHGYAGLLVRYLAAAALGLRQVDTVMLFSLAPLVSYYCGLGARVVRRSTLIQQPGGMVPLPSNVKLLAWQGTELSRGLWRRDGGAIEVRSLPW